MPSATVQPVTREDLLQLEQEGKKRSPPALMSLSKIAEELGNQRRAHALIGQRQDALGQEIDRISRDLKSEVRGLRIMELRTKAEEAMGESWGAMEARGRDAEEQVRYWHPAAVRRRATFTANPVENAAVVSSWILRLGKVHPAVLVEHARDAAQAQNLALAELVLLEAEARESYPKHLRTEVHQVVQGMDTPASTQAIEALQEIVDLASDALLALQETRSGQANPMRKLVAGFAARDRLQQAGKGADDLLQRKLDKLPPPRG